MKLQQFIVAGGQVELKLLSFMKISLQKTSAVTGNVCHLVGFSPFFLI